jgi:hypothetical protein
MGFFDDIIKPVLGGAAGFLVGGPTGAMIGAGIGASMNGSDAQVDAANNAASAQMQAAREANAMQRYMYDTNRSDMEPFRDIELQGANIGIENLERMNSIVSPGFKQSEAYNFNLNEGINALDKSAVASGRSRNSDTMRFASGLASNEYNNYLNRIQNLAGVNTGYANALTGAGQNYANRAGFNTRYAGDASAQGALAAGQSEAQMWGNLGAAPLNALSAYSMYQQPNTYGNTNGNAMMGYLPALPSSQGSTTSYLPAPASDLYLGTGMSR